MCDISFIFLSMKINPFKAFVEFVIGGFNFKRERFYLLFDS